MLTRERKAFIRDVLRREGRVVAKTLSRELGLSEDTIRRDLREMAAEGLLQRVHGGALPAEAAVLDFGVRRSLSTTAKAALGREGARLISPGQVVFLDGGTTNVQLARSLPATLKATVVTHSPSIAVELAEHPSVDVELIGGRLYKHSVVSVGASALEGISRVRPNLFFLGVTGVHPAAGLTTGDAEEAAIKRAIRAQSAETVVLCALRKIGVASPFVIGPLGASTKLIIETGADTDEIQALEASGAQVLVISDAD